VTDAHDPLAALNGVLSEVIDFVAEVKQARYRFSAPAALHAELDLLFDDARSWARLLVEEDDVHGVSPLGSMPSVAGRRPQDLGPGATAAGVGAVLEQHLARLDQHVAAALNEQPDKRLRAVLNEVEVGVRAHRKAMSAL
jgi:hypothetical protein